MPIFSLVVICFVSVEGFIESGRYRYDPLEGVKALEKGLKEIPALLSSSSPETFLNEASSGLSSTISSTAVEFQSQFKGQLSSVNFDQSASEIINKLQEQPYLLAPIIQLVILLICSAFIANAKVSTPEDGDQSDRNLIYKNSRYSPSDAESYYSAKRLLFISRAAEVHSIHAIHVIPHYTTLYHTILHYTTL